MQVLLIGVIVLETALLIGLFVAYLKRQATYHTISEKSTEIVKGKLDGEDIRVGDRKKGDILSIANGFNAIKSNLLTFIESTKVNVITLSDAIDVLSSSVEANFTGNEQIANGVSTVAEKSAKQLELVEKNIELIESSNLQIEEIDQAISQIKEQLNQTVSASKEGIQYVDGYAVDIERISKELSNINELLRKFNDEIKQIEEVGNLIIGINDQLMLLAFNASIEAARAGQAGKGFSVVADEMNKMSIETKEGMSTINRIVSEIIESSKQVSESVFNCEDTFNTSKKTFDNVNQSFKTINSQALTINGNMEEIFSKTGMISKNSANLKQQANDLHEASVNISEKTHEIAAASEETAAESSQISTNVEQLGEMLTDIQKLLKQFSTAVVPTTKKPSKQIKIAVLSMLDNDFWFGVRKGVFYAQKELNPEYAKIEYFPFAPKPGEAPLAEQVKEKIRYCIENHFDGIIFPGFIVGGEAIVEAVSKGIKAIPFNCDCAKQINRLAFFSPNGYEAGALAAKCMVKAVGKNANIAIMTGDLSVQVNQERKSGFINAIKANKGIHIVEDKAEIDDEKLIYQLTTNILKEHKELNAIFLTSGMLPTVAKAIEDMKLTGKVVVLGYDENEEIYNYIKKGIIYSTICQDPFGQGHDPSVWLYNHLVTGEPFPKEHMSCRLSVIDRESVDNLII